MKATLFVDETGNFEASGTKVSMSGVLFANRGNQRHAEYVGRLIQAAAPAAPIPLHASRSFHPVHFALGLIVAGRSGALADAADQAEKVEDAVAALSPNVAERIDGIADGQAYDELERQLAAYVLAAEHGLEPRESPDALLGQAVGQRLCDEKQLVKACAIAAKLHRSWQAQCPNELAAALDAVGEGAEPAPWDVATLAGSAAKGPTSGLWAAMNGCAHRSRAVLTKVLRVVLADRYNCPFWVGAGETATAPNGATLLTVRDAALRWLSQLERLLRRTVPLALSRGWKNVEILALCPRAVGFYAQAQNTSVRNLYRAVAAQAAIGELQPESFFTVRFVPNWKAAADDARYVIIDVAANAAADGLGTRKDWQTAKLLLDASGIKNPESAGRTTRLPHAHAAGAVSQWLENRPTTAAAPQDPNDRQWAWDQAHMWLQERGP